MYKIALFIPNLEGGGAERAFVNLANGFVHFGHHVDLILAQKQGVYFEDLSKDVNIYNLEANRFKYMIRPLIKYLKNFKPMVLISALERANLASVIARALSGINVKLILTEHCIPSLYYKSCKKWIVQNFPKWGGYFYRCSDKVVGVSHGVAKELTDVMNISKEKVTFIPNPVVTPQIFELSQCDPGHPWMQSSEIPVIVTVGRLVKQKDHETLLLSIYKILKQRKVRLVIVGEGEEKVRLKNLARSLEIEKAVDFVGFTNNPFAYMKRAAVFVLSSRFEGLGNVLIEAMALGTPIVSTDCKSGPAEILAHGRYGRLVPVGDPDALASAIIETLDKPIIPPKEAWLQYQYINVAKRYLDLIDHI